MITPMETYWNSHSDTLRDVQHSLTPDRSHYEPLPDQHPLLRKSYGSEPTTPTKSSTPGNLPKVSNGGPSTLRQDSPSLRGSKYGVIPPVKPKVAFTASVPVSGVRDEDDSWGEDSEEEPEPYPGQYPYPMIMYPMIVAPHPHTTPHKAKNKHRHDKGNIGKKKVHYRNTPTYLSSRENTKHEPMSRSTDGAGHTRSNRADPFDPRSNSVLARYQYSYVSPRNETLPPDHPLYPASFYYCEELLNKELPHLVQEVVKDSIHGLSAARSSKKQNFQGTSEKYLSDAIATEINSVVKETTQELVEEHLQHTVIYDHIFEMTTDIIQELAPSLLDECLEDILLEDIVDEDIVLPLVEEGSEEVAMEVLTHYSDKVRQRDIREIKRTSGIKLEDSLCLDYLLAHIARQGELWTEGEHANKLLDELMLGTVITEYFGVLEKKRQTTDNKPLRRFYEKVVTDVVTDVLLEELTHNLDEDMADLDEYERGVENTGTPYRMPADLKRWFDMR